ncbi:MAG: HupE/UreJ family protein [Burkholderiaceae bacterium]
MSVRTVYRSARTACIALCIGLLGALPPLAAPARAHASSDAHLSMLAEGARVQVRWDVALRDLAALVPLDADTDGTITVAEWRDAGTAITAVVSTALDVRRVDGAQCLPGPVEHAVARRGDGSYAVFRFVLACPGPADRISVSYGLMAGVDTTHRALLDTGNGVPTVLRPGDPPTGVVPGAGDTSFGGFVIEGVSHILDGVDHLAFVLALALAAVGAAAADRRALRPTLARLVGLLTLFTVAHSFTLTAGALGWLALPSRWVESAIAASVAVAGVQAWRAARIGRAAEAGGGLVFVFGLMHGFGFGAALADAGFGGRPAVVALAGFNLGVELGQLAVLAVLVPVLWWLHAAQGRRAVVGPVLAGMIVLAGVGWFVQRVFELDANPILASAMAW